MEAEICYYLGIDGGGTKTEFVLANEEGEYLSNVILGACNPNDVGMEKTLEILNQGIQTVCGDIPLEKISVFAGIAGGSTGENGCRIYEFLMEYAFGKVGNGSDALNAVAAFLGKEDGIAVIMGTGSIAFAQVAQRQRRVGGYGYLLGDAGSGFAIGRDGICAALADEDGSGPCTVLRQLVHEKCGGNSVLEQLSMFYNGGKRLIANYAPCVFAAYEMGDHVAEEILMKNMGGIAALIKGAAMHLPKEQKVVVVLGGGITKQKGCLIPMIQDKLSESEREYDIRVCTKSMVYGALLLAGMKNEGDDSYVKDRNAE